MADSGLDWDIEEVDDIPITSTGDKNGLPQPVKGVAGTLVNNFETTHPFETQQSILKSSAPFSEECRAFQNEMARNTSDMHPIAATTPLTN
ncbi:hypothetical protein EVAR_70536_1 [Eumeta japonica]|uniref:Uncharacterized protein n=1 Tax=Eumeta variegata TaxID=151549 RepID=A0A4C1SC20_EUMVA|nr:hypothetical protein EVAR_70536_1 [Eumeta japonica]